MEGDISRMLYVGPAGSCQILESGRLRDGFEELIGNLLTLRLGWLRLVGLTVEKRDLSASSSWWRIGIPV